MRRLRQERLAVLLTGVGNVGSALLGQLKTAAAEIAERESVEIRIVAITNSRRMVLEPEGLDLTRWRQQLADGEPLDAEKLQQFAVASTAERRVLVDCTASAAPARIYRPLLESGVAVVAANKLPFAGRLTDFREFYAAAERGGTALFHEATVGAGLPVLSSLADLNRSGDRVERVDGVLSGTVNAVLNRLAEGETFSEAVRAAHADGLTEPHPWQDLSGGDVARKLCILGRLLGHELEFDDIVVEPVIAGPGWEELDVDAFWQRLPEVDDEFEQRRRQAAASGARLRYVASLDAGGARVALESVPPEHPAHALAGADNLVAFTTSRYRDSPLVLRGPGAGTEVTAAGVFADLLRVIDRATIRVSPEGRELG